MNKRILDEQLKVANLHYDSITEDQQKAHVFVALRAWVIASLRALHDDNEVKFAEDSTENMEKSKKAYAVYEKELSVKYAEDCEELVKDFVK